MDYKALYEQQLAENSNLKAEIESRDEMDEKATEWIEEVFDSDTWDPVEVGKWVKELKEELEEEIQELKSNLNYDPEEAEIVSKDFIKRLELENEKLKKTNRMLSASMKRTLEADWKNKFHSLEKEATLENDKLKQQIKQMKPISKDTEKEWDAVFKATTKEISDLKQYQKDIDSVEENLLEILQEADVKDKFGDTYEELTYEMIPEIVKALIERM